MVQTRWSTRAAAPVNSMSAAESSKRRKVASADESDESEKSGECLNLRHAFNDSPADSQPL